MTIIQSSPTYMQHSTCSTRISMHRARFSFFSDIISRRKMLDICVTVLCGIPGSGKSTFAKSLIDKSTVASQGYWGESKSSHWLLVSYDEIIPTDVEKNIIEKEVPFFKT